VGVATSFNFLDVKSLTCRRGSRETCCISLEMMIHSIDSKDVERLSGVHHRADAP